MASTGMIIDGVLGSQCVDSSGEVLDVEGADITDLEEGRGVLNYEHQSAEDKDETGKPKNQGQEIVGKITYAKKVMTEGDCDNARQRAYWKKVKHPFVYGVCRLYDGAGHEGAKALAAQIRDHHANGEPILVRFSVEGSTLEKDGPVLKRSVIRRVALTLKPCNRTADSGLLEDPNAPQGFDKKPIQKVGDILADIAEDAKKMEHEHPGFTKLGGTFVTEYTEFTDTDHRGLVKSLVKLKAIKKAMEAGSTDAAPSTLTGGAALQREDLHGVNPVWKKKAKAILKNTVKAGADKAKLRELLKQSLPEASDEFIDHFVDAGDELKIKLKKNGDEYPKPNPELPGIQSPRVDRSKETPGVMSSRIKGGVEMKEGGQLMLPPPGKKRKAGITPIRLKLQQHFPKDDLYKSLLDPDWGLEHGHITPDQHALFQKTVHDPWHRAMRNWLPLNKALKDGKVPKGILAKSVVFAAMSPNTSVPNQERYYGHWMDMLHEGIVDPLRQMGEPELQEFTRRATTGELPHWNREYFGSRVNQEMLGSGVEEDDDKGELPQIRGLRNAHLIYPYLEHLTSLHKDDTQAIAGEMMHMKDETNRWKNRASTAKSKGKPEPKPLAQDDVTNGYGPKLTRYLLGMMGGGNMIVPDRHMIRSTFDLDLDSPVNEKLATQVFTDAKNEKLLRAVDHNFFVNHPAVEHVLKQFPKHFQGREQQAIFPAFWLHWLTIGHHDRLRGRESMAFNTDTDHAPFWDSVRDEMIKHGIVPHPMHDNRVLDESQADDSFDFGHNASIAKSEPSHGVDPWPVPNHVHDTPVWLKAAGAVAALTQRWGANPAMLAFFSHIAPKLMKAEVPVAPVMAANAHPAYHPHVLKAEALLIDLKKALTDARQEHPALGEVAPQIHHVYGYHVGPDLKVGRHDSGRFTTAGNHLHLLEDYHGDLGSRLTEGPLDEGKLNQIEKLRSNHKFDMASMAEIRSGARPELWQPPAPQSSRPASSFDYIRPDQSQADHLEFVGGKAHLNGQEMNEEQTNAILHHIKNGHAKVRYRQSGDLIRKMELVLERLMKTDDPAAAQSVHAALGKLDELVRAGHLAPEHADALRNHAFKDPMTGHTLGNKFAYTDFRNRADSKGGIHIVMDGNDFKSINDKYGHETGDAAIKSMGTALRQAMDESVGSEHGKLFRIGGDEFAAHVPTHEHAAKFARALRNKLEGVVPIQGSHKLSMGMGFGTSPEEADKALYEAKKQKYHPESMIGNDSRKWVSKYAPGAAPSLAHSLVPGFEGPLPLDQSQLQVKPPPSPQPQPEAPAPVIHTPPAVTKPKPPTSAPPTVTP